MQGRQGSSPGPSLLSMGGSSNARLMGASMGGTAGAAGITAVPTGAKGLLSAF